MSQASPLPSFGIVAEGVTDQAVIENILIGYFAADGEEPYVQRVQPPPMDTVGTTTAPPPGGWGLVLRFFKDGDHRKALQTFDYLVIQIDTDVSEQPGYDVPHREDGRELTVDELVARVTARFTALAGEEFLSLYGQRLLFAVAVHGIECWLLPLLYDDRRAGKITGCLSTANEALRRQNESPLSKHTRTGDSKNYRAYDAASHGYLKRRKLIGSGEKNRSLGLFLERLGALRAVP